MWQPPSNKHLCENSTPYINATQQTELAANLLQMQKLHLADILPPLTTATVPVPQSLYSNADTTPLVQNIPAITVGSPTHSVVHNLQQYLRRRAGGSSTISSSEQWPPATDSSDNRSLLLSNSSLLATDAAAASSYSKVVLPAAFLGHPPVAALPNTAQIPSGPMLPLNVLAETFSRLNALHLTNPNLAQTIGQWVANTSAILPSNFYCAANNGNMLHNLSVTNPVPFTPSLPSNKNLHLFKQYLSMEQQQQLEHLLHLNSANTVCANSSSRPFNTSSTSSLPSSVANGYYNASLNLNQLLASTSNTSKSSGGCFPKTFGCDQKQQEYQLLSFRKRRNDLKDIFTKNPNNLCQTLDLTDSATDDLLPPPKKKWIRHYLKGIYFKSDIF